MYCDQILHFYILTLSCPAQRLGIFPQIPDFSFYPRRLCTRNDFLKFVSFVNFSGNFRWINLCISTESLNKIIFFLYNVWFKKTWTIYSSVIIHSSKNIWVIKLSVCQNDPLIGESFRQKDSLITQIFFELWLITLFGFVQVFLNQTLYANF